MESWRLRIGQRRGGIVGNRIFSVVPATRRKGLELQNTLRAFSNSCRSRHSGRSGLGNRRVYNINLMAQILEQLSDAQFCAATSEDKTMSTDTATLNDMIQVLNDGKTFYEEAVGHVKRTDLKALFSRMARTKGAIASDLRTAVVANGGKPSEGGTFAGALRKAYAEVATKLSTDKDYTYIAQLEEFEDRILYAFKDAQAKSDDEGVRTIAARYMPEVLRDHNEMRGLKHAKAA
jgi:uncharacterized protein (TIGR02284 family)